MKTSKISILTPSYNDGKSIVETLMSVVNQTYKNWEIIIIDDGSTDDTKKIIKNFKKQYDKEDRIKYLYQENADQLNAILNGINYITGDYVYILHSDDLLPSDDFFKQGVQYLDNNRNTDAIIGDLIIINEKTEVTNRWKALKYVNRKEFPAILILNNGCNIYGDFSLQRKKTFINQVKNNYLTWNTPFWIDMTKNAKMLNVHTVDFPILKYRIHSDNYANNEVGKFNALNGELRTLTNLMKIYSIRVYKIQKLLLKFLRMPGVRKFKLTTKMKPFCCFTETADKDKYLIVKSAIENSYGTNYNDNEFLVSLLEFYKNINNDNSITLKHLNDSIIYQGKDIRFFTKKLFSHELDLLYYEMFEYMKKGIRIINVKNNEEKDKLTDVLKFLCIYPYIEILVNKESGE